MVIPTERFKQVMARLAAGVTVVTVDCAGLWHGLTASSFTSLSADPPLVLVCVGKRAYSHDLIQTSGAFAVNILSAAQCELGQRFADSTVADRFAGVEAQAGTTGSPILAGSLGWVECRLDRAYPGGDHTIFVGAVVDGGVGEERGNSSGRTQELQPLLYFNRGWRRLSPDRVVGSAPVGPAPGVQTPG